MQSVKVLIVKAAEVTEAVKIVEKAETAETEKKVKSWIKTMHMCKIHHLTPDSFC